MSEPLVRERSSIDLDEFDRRFRQTESGHDHPLANLARLVDEHDDPYGDVFAEPATPFPPVPPPTPAARREPAFEAPAARFSGDFASIEAGLRGALTAHPEAVPHGDAVDHEYYAQQDQFAHDDAFLHDHEAEQPQAWAPSPPPHVAPHVASAHVAQAAPSRGRRPIYAIAGAIAVGIVGVGVAFAFKGNGSSPSEIKTIAAVSGPTKIHPPSDASSEQGSQDAAVLSKDNQETPKHLASREEQPVDLTQAVQENNSRNADTGGGQGDASSVPVPLSPSEARNAPASSESGSSDALAAFGAGMPAPKKVKVVSVKPDGTILPNDAPPAAAMPSVRSAATGTGDADPVAKASTPKTASTKTTGPKTTSRVAAAPKPISIEDASADDAAPAKPAKAKPQRLASAEPASNDDDTTASLGSKSGGFAVQLAAPGSEADARSASTRFSKKYAGALAGRHIGFQKAQSNGKSVYRVRVGSLSKDEAVSLCGKLKADGGSCFVAKN